MNSTQFHDLAKGLEKDLAYFDELPFTFWMSLGKGGNYQICYWNKGAEQIYGRTKNEAIGSNYIELFVDDHAAEQSMIDCDRVIGGWQHPRNCLAIDKDSQGYDVVLLTNVFRYVYRGTPVQAEMGINLTPSGFNDFITEEYKELRSGPEHETVRTLESFILYMLNLDIRRRTLWSRTFAHEIRSELAAIKHDLEELGEAFEGVAKTDVFKDIERAHRGLFLLSENFLFSETTTSTKNTREVTNGRSLRIKDVDFALRDQIFNVIEEYAFWASLRAIRIKADTDVIETLYGVRLKGTRDAFMNVLRNLLNNAVKHTDVDLVDKYGTLVINISCHLLNNSLKIEVENFGNISSKEKAHLFKAYYKDESNPAEGLHLGLSIAKQWTDAVEGSLELENVEDRVRAILSWPLASVGEV